jgi:hypothetical protein
VSAKKGHAPVVFEGDFFEEDVLRAGEAGAKALLVEPITVLGPARIDELCRALAAASGCE